MTEANLSTTPEPEDPRDNLWRGLALRMLRRQLSKGVARRLRLPAQQWPWPEAIESPKTVNFEDLAWLLEGLADAERTVDYRALCRAGRDAHARILAAAAWLQDHPSRWERLRGATLWSAVDALDAQGTELFDSCRPSYTMEAVVLEDGTLGACIDRVLTRPRAAGEMIVSSLAGVFGYSEESLRALLPQARLAGWVLLGDGA